MKLCMLFTQIKASALKYLGITVGIGIIIHFYKWKIDLHIWQMLLNGLDYVGNNSQLT